VINAVLDRRTRSDLRFKGCKIRNYFCTKSGMRALCSVL